MIYKWNHNIMGDDISLVRFLLTLLECDSRFAGYQHSIKTKLYLANTHPPSWCLMAPSVMYIERPTRERGIRHGEVALQQWLTSWYERLLSFSTVDKHTTHKSVYPHKTQTRKKQEKTYYYLCDLFRWEVKLNTHTHTHTTHCRNTQGLYGQAKYVYLTCNPITQEAKHRQNIWKSKYIETHFVYDIRNIRTPRTQDWSHAIKTTTPGNELISYYDDDDAASSYFTWFN